MPLSQFMPPSSPVVSTSLFSMSPPPFLLCKQVQIDSQWETAVQHRKSAWCSVMTQWDGMGGGEEAQEGGDICIHMTGSQHCTAETNTTLKQLCFSECMCGQSLSCVLLFANPWTVAHQASLSMGFSRQEYWSGLPFPSPGDLPSPGIEPRSPALQADSLPTEL